MTNQRIVEGLEEAVNLTERDRNMLGGFRGGNSVFELFDLNWANRMEELGLLEYESGCMDGSRSYILTELGERHCHD